MFYSKDKESEVFEEFFKIMSKYNNKRSNASAGLTKVAMDLSLIVRLFSNFDEGEDLAGALARLGVGGSESISSSLRAISASETLKTRGVSLTAKGLGFSDITESVRVNLSNLKRDSLQAKASLEALDETEEIRVLLTRINSLIRIIDDPAFKAEDIAKARLLLDYLSEAPEILRRLSAKFEEYKALPAGKLDAPITRNEDHAGTPKAVWDFVGAHTGAISEGKSVKLIDSAGGEITDAFFLFNAEILWQAVFRSWRKAKLRAQNAGDPPPPPPSLRSLISRIETNKELDGIWSRSHDLIVSSPEYSAARTKYNTYTTEVLEQGGKALDDADRAIHGGGAAVAEVAEAGEVLAEDPPTPTPVPDQSPHSGVSPASHGYDVGDSAPIADLPSGVQSRLASGFSEAADVKAVVDPTDVPISPSASIAGATRVAASNSDDRSRLIKLIGVFRAILRNAEGGPTVGIIPIGNGNFLVKSEYFKDVFNITPGEYILLNDLANVTNWLRGVRSAGTDQYSVWGAGVKVDAFDLSNMGPVRIVDVDMTAPINRAVTIEAEAPLGRVWLDSGNFGEHPEIVLSLGTPTARFQEPLPFAKEDAIDLVRNILRNNSTDPRLVPRPSLDDLSGGHGREMLLDDLFEGIADSGDWVAELNLLLREFVPQHTDLALNRPTWQSSIGVSPTVNRMGEGATDFQIPVSATHRTKVSYNDLPMNNVQQGAGLDTPMVTGAGTRRPSGLGPRTTEAPPVSPEVLIPDALPAAMTEEASNSVRMWQREVENAVAQAESEGLSGIEKNIRVREILNEAIRPTQVGDEAISAPTPWWARWLGADDYEVLNPVMLPWGYSMPRTVAEAAEDVADWMRTLHQTSTNDWLRVELAIMYAKEAGIMPPGAGRNIRELLFQSDAASEAARKRALLDIDIIGFKNDPRSGGMAFTLDDGSTIKVADDSLGVTTVTPGGRGQDGLSGLSGQHRVRGDAVLDGFGGKSADGVWRPSTITGVVSVEHHDELGFIVYNTRMSGNIPVEDASVGDKYYLLVDDIDIDSLPADVRIAMETIAERVSSRPAAEGVSNTDAYYSPTTMLGTPLSDLATKGILPEGAVIKAPHSSNGGGVTVHFPDPASRATLDTSSQVELSAASSAGNYGLSVMVERLYDDVASGVGRQQSRQAVSTPTSIEPGATRPGTAWSDWRASARSKRGALEAENPGSPNNDSLFDAWLEANPPPPREGNFPQIRVDEDFVDADMQVWQEAAAARRAELSGIHRGEPQSVIEDGMKAWEDENPSPVSSGDLVPATRWIMDADGNRTVYNEPAALLEYGRLDPGDVDDLNRQVMGLILGNTGDQRTRSAILFGGEEFGVTPQGHVPGGLLRSLEETSAHLKRIASGESPLPDGWRPVDRNRARRAADKMDQIISDIRSIDAGEADPNSLKAVSSFLESFPGNPAVLARGAGGDTEQAYDVWLAYRLGMANLKATAYELLGRKMQRVDALLQELDGSMSLENITKQTEKMIASSPAKLGDDGELLPSEVQRIAAWEAAKTAEELRLRGVFADAPDTIILGRSESDFVDDGLREWRMTNNLGGDLRASVDASHNSPNVWIRYDPRVVALLARRSELSQELRRLIGPPPGAGSRPSALPEELGNLIPILNPGASPGEQIRLNFNHPLALDWSGYTRGSAPGSYRGEIGGLTELNKKIDQILDVSDQDAMSYFQTHFLGRWNSSTGRWEPAIDSARANRRQVPLGLGNPLWGPWAVWRRMPDADIHFRAMFLAYVRQIKGNARSILTSGGTLADADRSFEGFISGANWLTASGRWGGRQLVDLLHGTLGMLRSGTDIILEDIIGFSAKSIQGADGTEMLPRGGLWAIGRDTVMFVPKHLYGMGKAEWATGFGAFGVGGRTFLPTKYGWTAPFYIAFGAAWPAFEVICWWIDRDEDSPLKDTSLEDPIRGLIGEEDESEVRDGLVSLAQDIESLRVMEEEGISTGFDLEDCWLTQLVSLAEPIDMMNAWIALLPTLIRMGGDDDSSLNECVNDFFDHRYVRSIMAGTVAETAGYFEGADWWLSGSPMGIKGRPEKVKLGIEIVKAEISKPGSYDIATNQAWTNEDIRANKELLVSNILNALWPETVSDFDRQLFPSTVMNGDTIVMHGAQTEYAPWNRPDAYGQETYTSWDTDRATAVASWTEYRNGLSGLIEQMLGCISLSTARAAQFKYEANMPTGARATSAEEGGEASDSETQEAQAESLEAASGAVVPSNEAELEEERNLQQDLGDHDYGCAFATMKNDGSGCWECPDLETPGRMITRCP